MPWEKFSLRHEMALVIERSLRETLADEAQVLARSDTFGPSNSGGSVDSYRLGPC
jgi:hypothetical protein